MAEIINLDNLSIWQQIDYGGMAKFHYSIRLFRQQKNKKHVTIGKITFRNSLITLAQLYMIFIFEEPIEERLLKKLLLKNMTPIRNDFEKIVLINLNKENLPVFVKGIIIKPFKLLFRKVCDTKINLDHVGNDLNNYKIKDCANLKG